MIVNEDKKTSKQMRVDPYRCDWEVTESVSSHLLKNVFVLDVFPLSPSQSVFI